MNETKRLETTICTCNPFNGILIGSVEDVNDYEALEVPEFVPTRSELLELLKHHYRTFLERHYFIFCNTQLGGDEIRLGPFAERRVKRIIELLGQDARQTVHEERDAFAESIGFEKWNKFSWYLGKNVPGDIWACA